MLSVMMLSSHWAVFWGRKPEEKSDQNFEEETQSSMRPLLLSVEWQHYCQCSAIAIKHTEQKMSRNNIDPRSLGTP